MIPPPARPVGVARALGTALVLLMAVVLAGCAGEAAVASPVETSTVDLPKSYKFAPAAIVVDVGSTVTWTNHDDFTHNVRLDGGEAQLMRPGESTTHTFDEAGSFHYVCSLHPNDMEGTVTVRGG